MKRYTVTTLLFSIFLLTLWSCSKKEVSDNTAVPHLPATPYIYSTETQTKVASLSWTSGQMVLKSAPATPVTNDGAKLGRVLFHDYTISGTSCNGCHGSVTGHHSKDFFGQPDNTGTSSTAGQSIHPIIGMEDAGTLVAKISSTSYYQQLFKEAYGTSEVTTERISDALAQYMTAMAGSTATDQRFADPFK